MFWRLGSRGSHSSIASSRELILPKKVFFVARSASEYLRPILLRNIWDFPNKAVEIMSWRGDEERRSEEEQEEELDESVS